MNTNAHLTDRENEVAEWIAAGAIKKEISELLGIAVRTVENTARNIYEKTEARSIGQLATWYYHNKYNIPLKKLPTYEELKQYSLKRKKRKNENSACTIR